MSKTVISVRTDSEIKRKAQAVARELGIPLGTLINAYLREVASTGSVRFAVAEPMTPRLERLLSEAEAEVAAGEVSPWFDTADEAIAYLEGGSEEPE